MEHGIYIQSYTSLLVGIFPIVERDEEQSWKEPELIRHSNLPGTIVSNSLIHPIQSPGKHASHALCIGEDALNSLEEALRERIKAKLLCKKPKCAMHRYSGRETLLQRAYSENFKMCLRKLS